MHGKEQHELESVSFHSGHQFLFCIRSNNEHVQAASIGNYYFCRMKYIQSLAFKNRVRITHIEYCLRLILDEYRYLGTRGIRYTSKLVSEFDDLIPLRMREGIRCYTAGKYPEGKGYTSIPPAL
jgi:hypothetical protein